MLSSAYIAGVLHGDGWCTRLTIGLRAKDRDFVEAFAKAINLSFGLNKTPKIDERGYWLLRIGNKSGTFDSAKSYCPKTDEERILWVRGMFDSEGNAQCLKIPKWENSYQRRIAFYSTDTGTLDKVSDYLAKLGIASVLRPTKSSASHKGTKPVFELKVPRQENMTEFVRLVGSSISRKSLTLQKISATFQPPGWQAVVWKKAIAARWRNPCLS